MQYLVYLYLLIYKPCASAAILLEGDTWGRIGVVLAKAENTHKALETSKRALTHIQLVK